MMIWRRWSIAPSDQGAQPVVGSHPSCTENRKISEIPSMKFGTVIPTTFTAVVIRVINRRAVGIVFSTIASEVASRIDQSASSIVTGRLLPMACATLWRVV